MGDSNMGEEGSLHGIRVIEIAQGVSGPYCGKLLAGLGAEVIKVEPPSGDTARREGPFPNDVPDVERSGLFLHLNTGKRSCTLNLACKDGQSLLRRLLTVGNIDVLILGHRHSELEALGLDPAVLVREYPSLIVVNVSPFGLTGPRRNWLGTELVVYAASGYMSLTGAAEREPIKSYGSLIEYQAGAQAALGTLAALFSRDATGVGQVVDVSQMEAGTFLLGGVEQIAYFHRRVVLRNGTRLLGFAPQHSYPSTIRPCADGFVHCHSNNRHLDLLGVLIPHPRLSDPEVLGALMGHADEIDQIMDEWLADKSKRDVVAAAQDLRLPFTEVMTPGEVMADPHHKVRASFVVVNHPGAGPIQQPGAPFRMGESPWVTGAAPTLAEANADIAARLGLEPAEIARARALEVV